MYQKTRKKVPAWILIIPILIILFGAIFLAVGIAVNKVTDAKRERCTEPVTAVVFSYRYKTDTDGSKTCAPVFAYSYNGKSYSCQSNTYSSPPEFEIGEEVEASCNPDKPSELFWESKTLKIISTVFTVIGGVVCGIGFIFVIGCIVVIVKSGRPPVDEIADYEKNLYR